MSAASTAAGQGALTCSDVLVKGFCGSLPIDPLQYDATAQAVIIPLAHDNCAKSCGTCGPAPADAWRIDGGDGVYGTTSSTKFEISKLSIVVILRVVQFYFFHILECNLGINYLIDI